MRGMRGQWGRGIGGEGEWGREREWATGPTVVGLYAVPKLSLKPLGGKQGFNQKYK